MKLTGIVAHNQIKSISIVGMSKNAGKTVTLNHLIRGLTLRGIALGLTSTGRDGEKQDLVFATEKPPIWVPSGTIIATAREYLTKAEAKIEVLYVTRHVTPMGEVVVGRVREPGMMQLAGPGTARGVKNVIGIMNEFGAGTVLVDGAVNRTASASPVVTGGVILATGAAVGPDIDIVARRTALRAEFLRLGAVSDHIIREKAGKLLERGGVGVIYDDFSVKSLDIISVLDTRHRLSLALSDKAAVVVVGGALVNAAVEEILSAGLKTLPVIIVRDGTHVFLDEATYRGYLARGGSIQCYDTVNLMAVTVNPYSPLGYSFEPVEFLRRMRKVLAPIPVFDVVQEAANEERAVSHGSIYSPVGFSRLGA